MAITQWHNHRVEEIEVDLVLLALKERWGYDFTGYARASLKRRLLQIADYFDVTPLSRLLPSLLYEERVALTFINSITVPVSEFFRDPLVWKYVREEILPLLASFPRINLWQVGCGRGEETYTLAILLQEAGLLQRTRIIATDINESFLDEARQGRWSRRNFAKWRENYAHAGGSLTFDDYFEHDGDTLIIRDEMKAPIEFLQHNLVTDDVFLEVQFIVCRNVLIYFGQALQERVLEIFYRGLQRGGYLLLGRSENIDVFAAALPALAPMEERHRVYRKSIGDDRV